MYFKRILIIFLAINMLFSIINIGGNDKLVKAADEADNTTTGSSFPISEKKEEVEESDDELYEDKITNTPLEKTFKISVGQLASLEELGEEKFGDGAKYKSLNKKIVCIDKEGNVHGLKKGFAFVGVILTDGSLKKYKIVVKKKGMMYPEYTIMKGEKLDLQFSFSDKKRGVLWRSLNKKIASVNKNGSVKALSTGKVKIEGKKGKVRYLCKLKVIKHPKSIIYLTFDDGPSRSSTPKILKILKKMKVKATFFELKPAIADYDLTRKILKEGHTLALHGYSHKYNKIYKSESIYRNNLDRLQKKFFKKFNVWCTLSRFPGGSSNMVSRYNRGIMTRLSKKLAKWGYRYYDWNVSSSDAGGAKNAKQVYSSIKKGLKKGRENVILMHDFRNNYKTINALKKVIKYGKKHGYKFKAMTAATKEVHHGINN